MASPLSKEELRKFKLIAKSSETHNVIHLKFELPGDGCLNLPTGKHIKICTTVDGNEVQRSYTPTSLANTKGHFDLMIKVYPQGKMSQFLNKLHIGDHIEAKGPVGIFSYEVNKWKHLVMVAGGSGITPMIQISKAILHNGNDQTTISLFFFNSTTKDVLLKKELEALAEKHPNQFKVIFSVSRVENGEEWKHHVGRINSDFAKKNIPGFKEGSLVLICGPSPFNQAVKDSVKEIGYPVEATKVL